MTKLIPTAGLTLALSLLGGCMKKEDQPSEKLVFAHYMATLAPKAGDATVEDYREEIRQAQSHGIDGFSINCGGWSVREPRYKERVLKIYEAARQENSGFRLMISADFASKLSLPEFKDMVETFRDHPNQFRIEDRVVISTYSGGHTNEVTDFVAQEFTGKDKVFFLPYYHPRPANEMPTEKEIREVIATHPSVDGFFYFGAAGDPFELARISRDMSRLWHESGRRYMAPVSPFYRGSGGNYRVFESHGFEGMQQLWLAAIESDADFVQIVTWNDWGECTYVAPFGPVEQTELWKGHWGPRLSHVAYLDASRYYLDWYKTGRKPAITRDALYYFYRPHPSHLQGVVEYRPHGREELRGKLGRPRLVETLVDRIHVTTFLTAPAELTVKCGGREETFPLQAGINNVSVPLQPGKPEFILTRDEQTLIQKQGEIAISADDAWANFNYFSGSATAAPPIR